MSKKRVSKQPTSVLTRPIMYTVIFLIVIAAIIGLLVVKNPVADTTSADVVEKVQSIDQLEENAEELVEPSVPVESQDPGISEEEVLDTLQAEAERQEIIVSDEEVEDHIQASLDAYGMQQEDLDAILVESDIEYEEYKQTVSRQLQVAKLVQENVDVDSIQITDDEVDEYINSQPEFFQDFEDDEIAYAALKQRVRTHLLQEKQQEVFMEYVATLE